MSLDISIVGISAVEGIAPNKLNFTISLSEPLKDSLTLKYSTVNGTAISGTGKDYTAVSNASIIFAAGETVKTISIDILNDSITEINKYFLVNVFIPRLTTYNPSNTDLLATTGIGTITDTLTVSTTTTLESTIESLTLAGTANINGRGNTLNNILTGNSGNNLLEGLEGQDTLEGKAGADTLKGGLGDDFYLIDNVDTIDETLDSGIDTVQADFVYTLGTNLENLILAGTAISGNGNSLNNFLTGNNSNNTLYGNDGNDTLQGNGGVDTLDGGLKDDTYVIDLNDLIVESANAGVDTVRAAFNYSLVSTPNLENVELLGTDNFSAIGNDSGNKLIGNNANNTLSGGKGDDSLNGGVGNDTLNGEEGNDVLEGGAGIDILNGLVGDDIYLLSNPEDVDDVINEAANSGTDTVKSIFNYDLKVNFENLVLIGADNINGTGNTEANTISGNSANNILDGLAGVDVMIGGLGSDTFIVESIGDTVIEENVTGIDLVQSSINYILGNNVENLFLTDNAITGTGNGLNNYILGNNFNNNLKGESGLDTLDGGLGSDTMTGELGKDIYYVDNLGDQVIETSTSTATTEIDLVKSSISYTLVSNVENLELIGTNDIAGIGNNLNNIIIGNSGKNNLVGNGGSDSLDGGIGNDSLDGSDGNDTLKGGSENDSLNGGIGNDSLDGGLDGDVLNGGLGDDTYVVDNFRDVVITLGATDGTDLVQSSVSYILGNHLENLTLTGSINTNGIGNELNNIILGNSGNNTLTGKNGNDSLDGNGGNDILNGDTGNDTLKGNSGIDTLIGGVGADDYYVDVKEDVIVENINEGFERVFSTATEYTLSDNLENLTLEGTSSINGTGNSLNNTIVGNSGFNFIDGGLGNDTMIGGTGNDSYMLDNLGDVVTETSTSVLEIDTVFSPFSYTIGDNLENLILIGAENLTGTGNSLNNILIGNSGNNILKGNNGKDVLDGRFGLDTLEGGTGNDTYIVEDSDLVTEDLNAGLDTVKSLINYTLVNNVENLVLLGTANLEGYGNTLNNLISGNSGNNLLKGAAGDDTLIGGTGNDTLVGESANDRLIGGTGADQFFYNSGIAFSGSDFGSDRIADFNRTDGDKIILGKTTFALASSTGNGFSNSAEFASVTTDVIAKGSSAKIVYSSETGNIFYNSNGTTLGNEAILTTLETIPSSLLTSDFAVI